MIEGDVITYNFKLRSECERLEVIFNKLIPSMQVSLKTKDIKNIDEILKLHFPKLEKKAHELANKCIKDTGCENSCLMCSHEYIRNRFNEIGKLI